MHRSSSAVRIRVSEELLMKALEPVTQLQQETSLAITSLQGQIRTFSQNQAQMDQQHTLRQTRDWMVLAVVLMFQVLLQWVFR